MTDTPIRDRAKRIYEIRKARRMWERTSFPAFFRNHTTASFEFQVLDTLRDIRTMLIIIAFVIALT